VAKPRRSPSSRARSTRTGWSSELRVWPTRKGLVVTSTMTTRLPSCSTSPELSSLSRAIRRTHPTCFGAALAIAEGRVCIFIEPIALYHTRDLLDGDGRWLAPSQPAELSTAADRVIGRVAVFGDGPDLLMVAFGNGLRMALRAAERLRADGVRCTVLDLRWLAPLPEADLIHYATHHSRVLVVDETRRSGGAAEAVMAVLLDAGYAGELRRVTSKDSFVPLGPAAAHVLLSEEQIVDAARAMCRRTETKGHDDE
jgi:2-oxoisovalerate dehydrogenase E1 component